MRNKEEERRATLDVNKNGILSSETLQTRGDGREGFPGLDPSGDAYFLDSLA